MWVQLFRSVSKASASNLKRARRVLSVVGERFLRHIERTPLAMDSRREDLCG